MTVLRRLVLSAACASVLLVARPVHAQGIDPGLRAEIDKLLELTHASEAGAQIATLVNHQLLDNLAKTNPNVPPRITELVKDTLDDEFAKAFKGPDSLIGRMVEVYAKHFTQRDIRGLVAFYSTDLGKKAIATMPAVMADSAAVGRAWAEAHMPAIIEAVQAKLRAEGFEEPPPNNGHVF